MASADRSIVSLKVTLQDDGVDHKTSEFREPCALTIISLFISDAVWNTMMADEAFCKFTSVGFQKALSVTRKIPIRTKCLFEFKQTKAAFSNSSRLK